MISDVLADAEIEIQDYLGEGFYGPPGDPLRSIILTLLEHMKDVRFAPGLDTPPMSKEATEFRLALIAERWPDVPKRMSPKSVQEEG